MPTKKMCIDCKKLWLKEKGELERICIACREDKCNICRIRLRDPRPRWKTLCTSCYYEIIQSKKKVSNECLISTLSDSDSD